MMMLGLLEVAPLARVPLLVPPLLPVLLLAPLVFRPPDELFVWPLLWANSGGSWATNEIPPMASDAIAMN